MTILVFAFTMGEAHLARFLLTHGEIDGLALCAEFFHRIVNLNMNESHLTLHLGKAGTNGNLRLGGHNALAVFHLQAVGHAAGLQLAEHHPRGTLVDERGLYAAVQGVNPSLIVSLRFPKTDNIVAIFIEFHLHAKRIVRAASKTVVALLVYPMILDFSHRLFVDRLVSCDKNKKKLAKRTVVWKNFRKFAPHLLSQHQNEY